MGNTASAPRGGLSIEDISRLLNESTARGGRAPVAASRRRPGEEIPNPSIDDAAAPQVGQDVDAEATAGESPQVEASAGAEAGDNTPYLSVEPDAWASDQIPVDLIQVAQAAETASGAAPAGAAEGGAGFGMPVVLGGLAAAAALGGGGGGGGTAAAPAPPAAPPAPPAPVFVGSFHEFDTEVGAHAPHVATVGGGTATFAITTGFDRETLPVNLSELVYDFSTATASGDIVAGAIDYRGLEVHLSGNERAALLAGASATGSQNSDVVWLANLGAVGSVAGTNATGVGAIVAVVATATDGGDAEVGISDLYIAVEGTGSVLATALIGADADNDSSAEVLIGGNVAVSAVGNNADADIFVEALGIGKVDIGDSTASATATTGNASAIQEIAAGDSSSIAAGSVVATADGDDHAFATGVVAASSEGTVTASNLTATADATMSSATAVVSASGSSAATVDTVNVSAVAGPSAADAAGRVLGLDGGVAHVGGLSVTATSAATARAVGGLEASGGGSVTAGDVEWKAMSGADRGIAQADGRVVSNGGQVTVGEVTVTADAPGTSAFGMVTALGGLAAEIEAGNIGVRATGIGGATATGSIHSGDLTVVTAGDLMVSASATEAPGTVNAFGIVSASGGTLDAGHVAVIANGEAGIASGSATGQGTGVLIFDSLTVTATGADAFGKIAPEGSSSVTVGSAAVAATGSDGPSGLLVSSRQVSEVSVGNLSVNGTGAAGDVGVQIAAHNASSIDVGNVSLTLDHASGFVDVFADDNLTAETIDDATVSVGDIEVTVVGEGSEARISVQQFFPQLARFEIHWASTVETVMGDVSASVGDGASVVVSLGNVNADPTRSASFNGLGDVSMTLSEQTFGAINVDALDGAFALSMNIEDLDAATLAGTPHTIINGFEGDTDNMVFNLDPADAADFRAIADQTTAQGLFNALSTALNGTVDYVFAVYSGADITGDGVAETNLGVLAYDVDGNGITSVLYMPGVTELSAADLNDPLA